jgi:aryl-alcohol dehydrogenase-like predicted oxidoreductase
MRQRRIGQLEVSAIGLGAMPMSKQHPDEQRSIATIHAALDAGVTLIDTADTYFWEPGDIGHNESLIARALASYGDYSHVMVATKGGYLNPGYYTPWTPDGKPEYIEWAAKASARRLRAEAIDLYQYHCPDPQVPYSDSVGALKNLIDAGVIRQAGICNVNAAQIRLAASILGEGLVSVQNELSPAARDNGSTIAVAARLGLAFLPWSPLGGIGQAASLGGQAALFAQIARNHSVSPQQVCLAWELALDDAVIPIPGASRPASIADSAAAASLDLTDCELAVLNSAYPLGRDHDSN